MVVTAVAAVGSHHGQQYDHDANFPVKARGLTWNDTYYADNNIHDVIAVFDVNGDKIRSAKWYMFVFITSLFVGYFIFYIYMAATDVYGGEVYVYISIFWGVLAAFITCAMYNQFTKMSKGINGLHVAVTKKGIHKDTNGFPFGSAFQTTTIVSTI
jgi:hypothetical protein